MDNFDTHHGISLELPIWAYSWPFTFFPSHTKILTTSPLPPTLPWNLINKINSQFCTHSVSLYFYILIFYITAIWCCGGSCLYLVFRCLHRVGFTPGTVPVIRTIIDTARSRPQSATVPRVCDSPITIQVATPQPSTAGIIVRVVILSNSGVTAKFLSGHLVLTGVVPTGLFFFLLHPFVIPGFALRVNL